MPSTRTASRRSTRRCTRRSWSPRSRPTPARCCSGSGRAASRPVARLLSFAGYGAMAAGAYVGGDLVFRLGNQVDRHAFDSHSTKWKALDVTEVPAGTLVKAKAGTDTLVLYRASRRRPDHRAVVRVRARGRAARQGRDRRRLRRVPVARLPVPPRRWARREGPGGVRPARVRGARRPPTAGSRRAGPCTRTDGRRGPSIGSTTWGLRKRFQPLRLGLAPIRATSSSRGGPRVGGYAAPTPVRTRPHRRASRRPRTLSVVLCHFR